jgi:hypothetical protein
MTAFYGIPMQTGGYLCWTDFRPKGFYLDCQFAHDDGTAFSAGAFTFN